MLSTSLSSFQNEQFGEIRTLINDDGEPWFVAKDVATALGYSNVNDAIIRHCKGVVKHDPYEQRVSGSQPINIIPESDLYRLILRSKLPQAEAFQDWVTSEVLPSIRKHGVYRLSSRGLSENDFIEYYGYFWLDIETLSKNLRETDPDSTAERLEASIFYAKEYVEKEYVTIIRGRKYLRDEGIYFISMLSADKKALSFCNTVREVLGKLKAQTIKSEKIEAVRAYHELLTRLRHSNKDINFIRNLIRYKSKELNNAEIATLLGCSDVTVAKYTEELITAGIFDNYDFLKEALMTDEKLDPLKGAKGGRISHAEKMEIVKFLQEGHSTGEAAKKFKRGRSTVFAIKNEFS